MCFKSRNSHSGREHAVIEVDYWARSQESCVLVQLCDWTERCSLVSDYSSSDLLLAVLEAGDWLLVFVQYLLLVLMADTLSISYRIQKTSLDLLTY